MVEEEHGVLLVIARAQGVAVAPGPLGDGLAAEDFQAGGVGRDGERQHELRARSPHEGGGEGDIGLVRDGRGGGQLLGPVHDDPLRRLLDDVQDQFRLRGRPLLVLRLLAAIDLRVAEGMGQEEVVLQAVVVVPHDVLAEVAARVPHGAEGVAHVVQA